MATHKSIIPWGNAPPVSDGCLPRRRHAVDGQRAGGYMFASPALFLILVFVIFPALLFAVPHLSQL